MEGFLSFLVFAVLFYVMMRFGCGAHMTHGRHDDHQPADGDDKHVDPVCGKHVDPNEGYGKVHAGTLYRFCSRQCLDTFEAQPEHYMRKQVEEQS